MDFEKLTRAYYARWLGLSDFPDGDCAVYCAARNEPPEGYGERFDVYALALRSGGRYVAYGDRARVGIARLDMKRPWPEALEAAFGKRPKHNVKFEFRALPDMKTRARALRAADYPAWRTFFLTLFPGDDSWLKEYFDGMAETGLAFGVFEGGFLVCATDLPGMPYMGKSVREIGINTLPDHRRKGYARDACVSTARAMIEKGICPMWSAGAWNAASRGLAEAVGFREFADAYSVGL